MSLINDVLNDLNQKSKAQASGANYHVETPFGERKTWLGRHVRNLVAGFLLINVFCLLGIYGIKNFQKKTTPKVVSLSKPVFPQTKVENIFEVSSVLPSINFSEFHLKKKFTSEKFLKNQTEIVQSDVVESKAETDLEIKNKGKNKETFFIKKFSPLSTREKSEQTYQIALELIEDHQYKKAQLSLEQAIVSDPTYIEPRQLQTQLFISLGELEKANQLADENLNYFPDNFHFVELKANILIQLGYADQALAILKKFAPEMNEGSADYYNLMAVAFEKLEKLGEAGGIYQQLVRLKPDRAAYWLGLAIAFEATRQPNQAIGAYSKAVDAYDTSSIISTYAKSRLHVLRG